MIESKIIQREKELSTIEQTCSAQNVDSSGWVALLDSGVELNEIIQRILAIKPKEEIEEPKEVIEEVSEGTATTFKNVKEETQVPEILKDIIVVRGTLEQFKALNQFIVSSGMTVERYVGE